VQKSTFLYNKHFKVVSNDQVAMKILEQINSRELRGEANFFPLNRIVNKPRRDVGDTVSYFDDLTSYFIYRKLLRCSA
jgi:chromosome segregation ATPase